MGLAPARRYNETSPAAVSSKWSESGFLAASAASTAPSLPLALGIGAALRSWPTSAAATSSSQIV